MCFISSPLKKLTHLHKNFLDGFYECFGFSELKEFLSCDSITTPKNCLIASRLGWPFCLGF